MTETAPETPVEGTEPEPDEGAEAPPAAQFPEQVLLAQLESEGDEVEAADEDEAAPEEGGDAEQPVEADPYAAPE